MRTAIYETLGQSIRARREVLNMTQGDLADRVALSRASVTNIELGRQRVLVDQLYRFAEALQLSPTELLPSGPIKLTRPKREALSPEVANWINRLRKFAQ